MWPYNNLLQCSSTDTYLNTQRNTWREIVGQILFVGLRSYNLTVSVYLYLMAHNSVAVQFQHDTIYAIYDTYSSVLCRSQWPRGLRRRSTATRLLRSWVRNPPGAWMFVCCECCVLSRRGLCDELITRPEEWCVVVCDLETSRMRRPWPALGRSATGKKKLCLMKWINNNSKASNA